MPLDAVLGIVEGRAIPVGDVRLWAVGGGRLEPLPLNMSPCRCDGRAVEQRSDRVGAPSRWAWPQAAAIP